MLNPEELVDSIKPDRTILFLGAGASVPSGGPTGIQLARYLEEALAGGERISDELIELCSILENRYTRELLVSAVRKRLSLLKPSGGLTVVPEYDWHAIYTTNFDTLVEAAFNKCGRPIVPIRSNYDYGKIESTEGTLLLKLHGCLKEDIIDGYKARMVLTERDYDAYDDYRQTLYNRLRFELNSKDVLFIGYSLKDAHLRSEIKHAAKLHKEANTPGKLYALIYNSDVDRASLIEDQGVQVCFGGIDEIMNLFSTLKKTSESEYDLESYDLQLPVSIRSSTIDVLAASQQDSNVKNIFNGYPATYADIVKGYTFERSKEKLIVQKMNQGKLCVSIVGVAGVGKTSMARRIVLSLSDHDYLAWEHRNEFPLKSNQWLKVESDLRTKDRNGILFIDDSPNHQRQVNILIDNLARVESPKLRVLLVGERSQWVPRTKSSKIFLRGHVEEVSQLEEVEIERLVNLLDLKLEIRNLVENKFTIMNKRMQIYTLKRKCSADMYVALKHIFAFESLDTIILKEYSKLSEELQDIYRTVAALEASGTRVHRQLIIRLLNVKLEYLKGSLAVLEGLVDEYDISPQDGLYGWRTRHEVVAQTLTRFKYAEEEEFFSLLKEVIESLNPTVYIERRTLNDLCNSQYGIRRILSPKQRLELYQDLIDKAPGERVPRHRIIYELLQLEDIGGAEQAIRDAETSVGVDGPVYRYKILLTILRARITDGILNSDRRALLLEAHRLALKGIDMFQEDKYIYMIFADIGSAFYDITGKLDKIDEAIEIMRIGSDRILDPQLAARVVTLERERIPLSQKFTE